MKINYNARMTKKDIFNAATNSLPLQKLTTPISVVACGVGEDVSNETGELTQVGYIVTATGEIYGTISKTAITAIENLGDLLLDLPENEAVEICVQHRKSKSDRDFITLSLV